MTLFIKANLSGRHAIVTGGGRGIGAAIAKSLSTMGARVTVMGRDVPALRKHAGTMENAQAVECDVVDDRSVEKAFAAAAKEFGAPYILVNNAGQAKSEKFVATTRDLELVGVAVAQVVDPVLQTDLAHVLFEVL